MIEVFYDAAPHDWRRWNGVWRGNIVAWIYDVLNRPNMAGADGTAPWVTPRQHFDVRTTLRIVVESDQLLVRCKVWPGDQAILERMKALVEMARDAAIVARNAAMRGSNDG